MKKILFFILLALSLSTYGQRYIVTKSYVDDSVSVHRQLLNAYMDSITALRSSLNPLIDVTAPTMSTATTNTTGDTITITMSETLSSSYIPDTSAFAVYANYRYVRVSGVSVSGASIYLSLNESILLGESVRVSYEKPAANMLQDASSNETASFSNQSVTNNVSDVKLNATLIARYDFEQVVTDGVGSKDGIASAAFEYSTHSYSSGSYSANLDGSVQYVDIPLDDTINKFSYFFTFRAFTQEHTNRTLLTNSDTDGGYTLLLDAVNGNFRLMTTNATDTAYADSDSSIYTAGTLMTIALLVDKTTGYAHFYVNGQDVDADTTIRTDFPVDDTLRIGLNHQDTLQAWGYLDNLRRYSNWLTETEIDSLHYVYGIYDAVVDTTAPSPDTAKVDDTGKLLEIYFDEDLYNSGVDTASFNFLEDGSQLDLSNPRIIGNILSFVCDSVSGGTTLSLNYDKTGGNDLRDRADNEVDTFTIVVENDAPVAAISGLAHYLFNDALTDNENSYDAFASGSFAYSTNKLEGTKSGNFDGNDRFVTTPAIPHTSQFTLSGWGRHFNTISTKTIATTINEGAGWRYGFDNSQGRFFLETTDGGTTTTVYSTTGHNTITAWIHGAIVVDDDADTVAFYINGQYDVGRSITSGIGTSAQIRFGAKFDDGSPLWGYGDDYQIYAGLLNANQIATIYNNVGEMVEGGGSVEPPNPDPEIFDIIYSQDFEDTELGVYTVEEIREDFPGVGWTDSWYNPTRIDSARYPDYYYKDTIAEDPVTSSRGLKLWQLAGTFGPSRGGEYFKFQLGTEHEELYFSYNVMFKPNTDWQKGGKLPYLAGGPVYEGAQPPAEEQGFSGLLMFNSYNIPGSMQYFYYHQNMPYAKYADVNHWYWWDTGEQFSWDIQEEEWHNITVRWVCNTFVDAFSDGNRDGFMEAWVDGEFVERLEGIEWLHGTNMDQLMNRIDIAWFYGGNDDSFSPDTDQWIIFDDFTVFQFKSGNGYPTTRTYSTPANTIELPNWPKTD